MSEQEKYRNTTGYAPSSARSHTGEVTEEYHYVPRSRSTPVRGGAHSKSRRTVGHHAKSRSTSRDKAKERSRQSVQEARRRREKELYTPSCLRKGRKIGAKELRILLIPVVAALAAVAVALFAWDKSTSYTFQSPGVQYYAGASAPVSQGSKMELNEEEGKAYFIDEEELSNAGGLPIYLQTSRKVVLPFECMYYAPRSRGELRAVCLSEVECKTSGAVNIEREEKSVMAEAGFLYDGGDVYIFLEPVTVSFNNYSVELPALSYVEAVYGGNVMLFNYETKESMMEPCNGTGTAAPEDGAYELSLLGDSMTLADGSRILLSTQPQLFEPVV